MTWLLKERLPYGQGGSCQFLLLIMIFPERADFSPDQEHDHEQEQEYSIATPPCLWNNEATP
jgi:hypothetical protein